jgi:hypothetical protein
MKSFNYTARDKSGGMKRGSVQAADRNAALHELTAQGLVPLSVTEGQASKSVRDKSLTFKYLIYVMIGLVLGGLLLMSGKMLTGKGKEAPKKVLKQNTVKANLKQPAKKEPTQRIETVSISRESPKDLSTNSIIQAPEVSTGYATNRRIVVASILPDGSVTNDPPRPAFASLAERALSVIANTQPGMPIPPLMVMPTGQEFIDALNKGIVVYDDESEETIQKKANVARAKDLLKEYIEKGGKPDDFLLYYRKELHKQFTERRLANLEMIRLNKEQGQEAALKYAEEMNKGFEERGIKKLQVPQTKQVTE